MELSIKDALLIIDKEHADWELQDEVIEYETYKGNTSMGGVFKHIPTKKYYMFNWQENDYEGRFDHLMEDTYSPYEVVPKIVRARIWVPK